MATNSQQPGADFSSRRKRRAAVSNALSCLSAVRDAEQRCLQNVPDSLQCTESYECGELAVDALDEIISLLSDVY